MTMAEDIRQQVGKAKVASNQKDDLAKAFNGVSLKLINQFIANVESGSVQIDDVTDLNKLFNMFLLLNNIQEGEGAEGALPTMAPSQKTVFEERGIVKKKEALGEDEEDEEYIDLGELANMDSSEIAKMLTEREVQVNAENEGIS